MANYITHKPQHTHLDVDEDSLLADFCWDQDAMSEKTKTALPQLVLYVSNSDRQATHIQ